MKTHTRRHYRRRQHLAKNGDEAIWLDDRAVSRVRRGGYGYPIEKNIALCYVPLAQLDTMLHVELLGERIPATVPPDPLYDAHGERIKQ